MVTTILNDFNLPKYWSSVSLKTNCNFKVIYEDFLYRLNNINLQQVVTMPTRNYFPITRTQQCPNSSKSTYFRPWVMILSSTYLRSTLRTPSKLKKGTDKHTGKTSKETSDFRIKFFSSVHSWCKLGLDYVQRWAKQILSNNANVIDMSKHMVHHLYQVKRKIVLLLVFKISWVCDFVKKATVLIKWHRNIYV